MASTSTRPDITDSEFATIRTATNSIMSDYTHKAGAPQYTRRDWLLITLLALGTVGLLEGMKSVCLPLYELLDQLASAGFWHTFPRPPNTLVMCPWKDCAICTDVLRNSALPFIVWTAPDGALMYSIKVVDATLLLRLRKSLPSLPGQVGAVVSGYDLKGFSIMSLPAELREMILRMVLHRPALQGSKAGSRQTVFTTRSHDPNSTTLLKAFCPGGALALTGGTRDDFLNPFLGNRQLYSEGIHLFYAENTFVFFWLHDLDRFLSVKQLRVADTSIDRYLHIRSIALVYHWWDRDIGVEVFKKLARLPNLRKITIYVLPERWPACKRNRARYDGIATLCDVLSNLTYLKSVVVEGKCRMLFDDIKRRIDDRRGYVKKDLLKKGVEAAGHFAACEVTFTQYQ